jgi:hypothetical protein
MFAISVERCFAVLFERLNDIFLVNYECLLVDQRRLLCL